MNYFDLYSSYPDQTIATAWDSQVKEAVDTTSWLNDSGGELFARFATCYAELRALPRGARRALQRQLARSSEVAAILPEYLQRGGRRLQHRMAWSLAGAALLLALGQGVSTAATITVTTNNPYIISDGQCSLIEAIVNANNDAATYPDCAAGSKANTIVLPANAAIILNAAYGNIYGQPVGLPPITSQITIQGNGARISRPANAPNFGLVGVEYPGDLTLENMTLSGGASASGGAVFNAGALTIKNSTISGNTSGGGIYGYYGDTTIENSTISGNTGGGVGTRLWGLTIINSIISGNAGTGVGGEGTINIENSTISGNAGTGVDTSFTLNIENSTISGNAGTGVIADGTINIENSTISGNIANHGGGVSTRVFHGIYGDYVATLTLKNSLVAGNQAAVAPEIENNGRNIVNANNFNLFGTNGNAGVSGFTPGPTDIVPSVSLAQILGPLKNNGGPTQTLALVAGSPAIDAGNPNGCQDNSGALLQTDQRGFPRNVDGNSDGTARCDIGAFEAKELFVVAAILPNSRSVQVGSTATAFATIINAGQGLATGCTISPITAVPAALTFQTTDPATNQVIGAPNAPVDIPPGAAQSFIFALTPNALIAPTDVQLSFECTNANPAPIRPGVNTLLFSASATPVPDIVALAATLNNDGIVNVPGTNGMGVFAVASVNMAAGDAFTVSADTGGVVLPINILICQTDPQTSVCLSPPDSNVPTTILSNETPTFGVFVAGAGDVSFIPETNRIFVRFKDSSNVTRGLTSVAVRTQ